MHKCKYCSQLFNREEVTRSGTYRGVQRYACRPCERTRTYRFIASKRGQAYVKKYNHQNKRKQSARRKLRYAVRTGKIQRPTTCFHGCVDTKLHAHHHDYTKPLEVTWLCPKHHAALHYPSRSKPRNGILPVSLIEASRISQKLASEIARSMGRRSAIRNGKSLRD